MQEPLALRHVYLTLPTPTEPLLNIMLGVTFTRYRVTRDQLLYLNAQIADALLCGAIDNHIDKEQLELQLSEKGSNGQCDQPVPSGQVLHDH